MLTAVPTLEEIVKDPARIDSLPLPALAGLMTAIAALELRIAARVALAQPAAPTTYSVDRLLTARQVAERLGRSTKWVYHRAAGLPFAVKVDGQHPRFSERGLQAWVESAQPR